MLYLKGESGQRLLVLETANLDRLRAGEPLSSPDAEVSLVWCPDIVRLAGEIARSGRRTADVVRLIDQSQQWPEAAPRPYHPARVVTPPAGEPDAPHPDPGPDVGLAPPAGGVAAGEHPAG